MAYDGSIVIDTQLDTSGLEVSLSKLCSSIETTLAKTGQSAGNAIMKGIASAMSNTNGITEQIRKIQDSFEAISPAITNGMETPFENAEKTAKDSVTDITGQIKAIPVSLAILSGAFNKNLCLPFLMASSSVVFNSSKTSSAIASIGENTDGIASKINKNIIKPINNMGKFVKTSSDSSRKSIDTMGIALTGACAGYEAMAVVAEVLNTAQTIGTAITSGYELVMKIKSKTTAASTATTAGATVAQNGLNAAMLANPIGLVVIAIVALIAAVATVTAGIIALFNAFKKNNEEEEKLKKRTEELTQETQELCEANKNLNDSIKNGQKDRKDSLASAEAEAVATEKLTDELYRLNDKQNKTVEDKEKMESIVRKLNDELPDLALNFDKETGSLSKNKDEVLKAIQAKKELAKQNAAVNMLTAAYEDQYKAEVSMNQLLEKRKELEEQIAAVGKDSSQAEKLNAQLDDVNKRITETSQTYNSACDEITYANQLMDASASETSTNMQYSASQIAQNFKKASENTEESSGNLKDQLTAFGETMVGEASKYGSEFISQWNSSLNDEEVKAMTSVDEFINHVLSKMDAEDAAKVLGEEAASGYEGGIKTTVGTLHLGPVLQKPLNNALPSIIKTSENVGKEATRNFFNGANNSSNKYPLLFVPNVTSSGDESIDLSLEKGKEVGFEFVEGIKQGVQEKTTEVTEAIKTMAQTVERDSNEAVKTIAKPLGGALVNGIELGATDQQGPLNTSIQTIVRNAIDAGKREADVNSPSKETRDEIGKPLVEGLVKGIDSEQNGLNKSMGGLLNNMLKFGKKVMGIHSPSTVMRDEIGAEIDRGIAQGIKENSDVVLDEFNRLLDALKRKRELDIINEDEYYTELEKLRDAYFAKGSEEWLEYTTEIYNYQQDLLEKQKDAIVETFEAMLDEADDAISELEKKQEDFEKKLKQNDALFITHTMEDEDGNELAKVGELRDYSNEIDKINEYKEALSKAEARLGNSAEGKAIYEGLLDMDREEAMLFAETIINASDKEIEEYLKSYKEYQDAVKDISRDEFADEWAQLDATYGNINERMKQSVIDTFGELAEEFFVNGELSAEKFGEGFLSRMNQTQATIKSNLTGAQPVEDSAYTSPKAEGMDAAIEYSEGIKEQSTSDEMQANIQSAGEAAGDALAKGINTSLAGNTIKTELEKTFGALPDDFFELGKEASEKFCNGFASNLLNAFATARRAFLDVVNSFSPALGIAGGGIISSASNTYNNSYNFYGSGQTVSQQLRQARADASLQKLRNI